MCSRSLLLDNMAEGKARDVNSAATNSPSGNSKVSHTVSSDSVEPQDSKCNGMGKADRASLQAFAAGSPVGRRAAVIAGRRFTRIVQVKHHRFNRRARLWCDASATPWLPTPTTQ